MRSGTSGFGEFAEFVPQVLRLPLPTPERFNGVDGWLRAGHDGLLSDGERVDLNGGWYNIAVTWLKTRATDGPSF